MRKPPQSSEFWFYWGMAIGALIGGSIVFMSLQTVTGWCSVEANCAREWFAASGTWVAVIAAVPPVYFLIQQIETSNRQHRRSQWSERRHTRALAVATQVAFKSVWAINGLIIEALENADQNGRFATFHELHTMLERLSSVLSRGIYSQAEAQIGLSEEADVETMQAVLAMLLKLFSYHQERQPANMPDQNWSKLIDDTTVTVGGILAYAKSMYQVADMYITETDALLNSEHH